MYFQIYFDSTICMVYYRKYFPSTDFQHHGSLFTLFLHSPLTALCYVCNVGDVPMHHWDRCQGYVDKFCTEASRLVTRCRIDEIEKGIGCIGESGTFRYWRSFKYIHSLNCFLYRFLVRSVFRWRFLAYADFAIRILWRSFAHSPFVSGSPPEAAVRTAVTCIWVTGTSFPVAHRFAVGHCARCAQSLCWDLADWRGLKWKPPRGYSWGGWTFGQ